MMNLGANRWDILVLGWYGDAHQNGIYNAAARLSLMVAPVSRVVVTFTSPLFAAAIHNRRMADLDHLLRRSREVTLVLGIPISAVLLLAPSYLSALLYGDAYRSAGSYLAILSAGQLIGLAGVPSSILLWMGGGERLQATISTGGAVLGIALCMLLVPIWGGMGASLATASSMVVTSLLFVMGGSRVRKNLSSGTPHSTDATTNDKATATAAIK